MKSKKTNQKNSILNAGTNRNKVTNLNTLTVKLAVKKTVIK